MDSTDSGRCDEIARPSGQTSKAAPLKLQINPRNEYTRGDQGARLARHGDRNPLLKRRHALQVQHLLVARAFVQDRQDHYRNAG